MTITVGTIVAPQGIKGQVRIKCDLDDPQLLLMAKPLKITHAKLHKPGLVIASVQGVSDRNQAETLRGTVLTLTRDQLPETGETYQIDLIGRNVAQSENRMVLGKLTAIYNFGAGDIIEVTPNMGETILLPLSWVVDLQSDPILVQMAEVF